MGQLNALAELQGINALTIEQDGIHKKLKIEISKPLNISIGNPIVFKDWQSYAVYRLVHWGLSSVNSKKITKQQAESAEKEYGGLGLIVLHCLPGNLLLPLLGRLSLETGQPLPPPSPSAAKEWLMSTEGTLRNVVAKEALQWRKGVPSQVK
jgi:leucine-rich repeat-containing protein 49